MEKVAILDYGAGNVKSVKNAVEAVGGSAVLTYDSETVAGCDRVILPGVGAFGSAMERIRERGLDKIISEVVSSGVPFLGICLGLQVLFESSEEAPDCSGLNIFKGKIVKIPQQCETGTVKIPHIGWNSLAFQKECPLFHGLNDGEYVYFVHSYYLQAADRADVAATTEYSTTLDVAVSRGNIFATQFHPEKSGDKGLQMLKNFMSIKAN